MRYLDIDNYQSFSCGVYMLTGFGYQASGELFEEIKADLRDCDGYRNPHIKKVSRYNWVRGCYEDIELTSYSPSCAMIMVSLNLRQAKFWRPILLEYDYVEVVKPIRNPNSNSKITIFIRQRKPRKKKEAKK